MFKCVNLITIPSTNFPSELFDNQQNICNRISVLETVAAFLAREGGGDVEGGGGGEFGHELNFSPAVSHLKKG